MERQADPERELSDYAVITSSPALSWRGAITWASTSRHWRLSAWRRPI